jgi:hypothetical protein
LSGLFKIENVSVYGQLIDSCVFGDGDDTFDGVTSLADCLDEKFDVYHASKSTGGSFLGLSGTGLEFDYAKICRTPIGSLNRAAAAAM